MPVQTSAVSSPIKRRMAGDSAAESGLYDALKRQIGSHLTACVPRSPKAKNISGG